MKIEPCPVCGADDCQVGSVKHDAERRTVYCSTSHCLIGAAYPTAAEAVTAWNRLSLALALIEDITTHVDSHLWAQENKWGVNEGWLYLRKLLADYREATK